MGAIKLRANRGATMKPKRVNIKLIAAFAMSAIFLMVFSSCSVISRDMQREAARDVTFEALRQNAEEYKGETVIIGGHILEIRNLVDETKILVLQAPLNVRDEPKDRDLSKGRFVVVCDGFLDPAIYERGRRITVAGEIIGEEQATLNDHRFSMPVIRSREIFLWKESRDPMGYYYYDPFYPWPDPYFRHRPGIYRPGYYRW